MNEIIIREATTADAEAILRVYAWYVEHTAITYEYDVPTVEEFRGRIAHTLERYPYLVAERDGEVIGYAYAGSFHSRAAYDWCCELSIYIAQSAVKCGLGRRLYQELEDRLHRMGILNLYACIAATEHEDEYLTNNSVRFHDHLGFRLIGTFRSCGLKFGRWYDMVWMEKLIGTHSPDQAPVIAYPALKNL